jgi:hypothetical protein
MAPCTISSMLNSLRRRRCRLTSLMCCAFAGLRICAAGAEDRAAGVPGLAAPLHGVHCISVHACQCVLTYCRCCVKVVHSLVLLGQCASATQGMIFVGHVCCCRRLRSAGRTAPTGSTWAACAWQCFQVGGRERNWLRVPADMPGNLPLTPAASSACLQRSIPHAVAVYMFLH